MDHDAQPEILAAADAVAHDLLREHRGIGPWREESSLRPAVVRALEARGYRCTEECTLSTTVRPHRFDIIWERDGEKGAVELKLKGRGAPADDSRLFFWYDLKWLEAGIEAGSFSTGTAILLTDLQQLYEETGRGDWRHDYYRIGHTQAHRCNLSQPDHSFERKYKPGTAQQFPPELFPLRVRGCYDFRDKWHVVPSGVSGGTRLFLLAVPVIGEEPAAADGALRRS